MGRLLNGTEINFKQRFVTRKRQRRPKAPNSENVILKRVLLQVGKTNMLEELKFKTFSFAERKCLLHNTILIKNCITDACSTADCCPLLTICPRCCPRHAPDDAPDIPFSIIFDILRAPAFQNYSTWWVLSAQYLSTDCHILPMTSLNAFVYTITGLTVRHSFFQKVFFSFLPEISYFFLICLDFFLIFFEFLPEIFGFLPTIYWIFSCSFCISCWFFVFLPRGPLDFKFTSYWTNHVNQTRKKLHEQRCKRRRIRETKSDFRKRQKYINLGARAKVCSSTAHLYSCIWEYHFWHSWTISY